MMSRASSKCGRERVAGKPGGNRPLLGQSCIMEDKTELYLRNNMEGYRQNS
jgi:hypothetical protein